MIVALAGQILLSHTNCIKGLKMNKVDNFRTIVAQLSGIESDEKGQAVAMACNWCGDEIFGVMYAALEEANFHKEANALHQLWRKLSAEN